MQKQCGWLRLGEVDLIGVMLIGNTSNVSGGDFYYAFGFRPLVCLNSNIQLEKDGDGYKIK